MTLVRWFAFYLAFAVCAAGATLVPGAVGDPPPTDVTELDKRISRLIEQLGSDQFAVRERAQAEIERIGLPAFDALDAARSSDDIEIALRARYLLRIMSVDWSQDEDPPEIKSVLKAYGEQNEAERKSRMERLSAFASPRAVLALCRLARFETNPVLAKEAALLVMTAGNPEDPAVRTTLVATIRKTMGGSKRPTADWLRWYARTLEAPQETIEGWQRRADAEVAALRKGQNVTSGDVVRALLRWQCGFLRDVRRNQESELAARRVVEATDPSESQLTELVTWLVELEYWNIVQEVAERHSVEFEKWPLLLYLAAEAQAKQGRTDEAEAIAGRALRLNYDSPAEHLELGIELRERGLYAWAERELRHTIAVDPDAETYDKRARFRLAEMLFDLERPLDAANVWQELLNEADKNEQVRSRLMEDGQSFRSRMYYFYAQHYLGRNEVGKAREQLEMGLRNDPMDADVLIATYRLPDNTPEFRKQTTTRISEAASHFHELSRKWEQNANLPLPPDQREEVNELFANTCNQYAWLVANTEGDFDEALRLSHRSIELMPKAASYLDTLGRCYYAKQDYVNAVKFQSLAAKREPHTQQIKRQLVLFQKALAESRNGMGTPARLKP